MVALTAIHSVPKNTPPWRAVRAQTIGTFRGGNGFPLRYQGNVRGEFPYFKVSDMNNVGNERALNIANNYIDDDTRRLLGAHAFPTDTIVFAKVGAAVFLERKRRLVRPSCIDNNLAGFVVSDPEVDPAYVHHFFESVRFGQLVSTTALPSLNGTVLNAIEILLPPSKREQCAIAEALSDADALIEELERLIAKKCAIKKGVMQDLLSGRRRLPGFSGEWARAALGEVFQFKNGLNKEKKYFGYGSPIVNYMDVFARPGIAAADVGGRVCVNAAELDNFSARRGDLFFTRTSETVDEIGMASTLLEDLGPAVFSGFILRARPLSQRVAVELAAYLMRSDAVRRQIVSTASYTTRALTNGRLLSKVEIDLPPLDEQIEMAKAIADIEAEVAGLEVKLGKARQVKLGMMQELLTGKVRLV